MALSPYFSQKEIACPCCGSFVDTHEFRRFLYFLDKFRQYIGTPVHVNSFYRCPAHNQEVGGHPNSGHLRGVAVDVRCDDHRQRARYILAWSHIIRQAAEDDEWYTVDDPIPFHIEIGRDYLHFDLLPGSTLGNSWITLKKYQ